MDNDEMYLRNFMEIVCRSIMPMKTLVYRCASADSGCCIDQHQIVYLTECVHRLNRTVPIWFIFSYNLLPVFRRRQFHDLIDVEPIAIPVRRILRRSIQSTIFQIDSACWPCVSDVRYNRIHWVWMPINTEGTIRVEQT